MEATCAEMIPVASVFPAIPTLILDNCDKNYLLQKCSTLLFVSLFCYKPCTKEHTD